MVDDLDERVRKLEVSHERLATELRHAVDQLERVNSGINRLVWIIATGFIVGLVQWVIKGGLAGG